MPESCSFATSIPSLTFLFFAPMFLFHAKRQWRRGACRRNYNTTSAGLSKTGNHRKRPTKQNSAPKVKKNLLSTVAIRSRKSGEASIQTLRLDTTERDQPSKTQHRKSEKPSFDCGYPLSKKWRSLYSNLQKYTQNKEAQTK